MNVLNLAQGLLIGGVPGLLSAATAGSPSTSPASGTSASAGSLVSSRDSAITDFLDASSSVNLLQQAAATQTSDSSQEPLLNLPPLAPMPAPKPAPAVPTDDHGQSNIVFSSSDADGAFIH